MNFLSLFTPTNISIEKEKFFTSNSYNPVFTYDREVKELTEYLNKHESKKVFVKALESENSERITSMAKVYFQTEIDEVTLESANEILKKGFSKLDSVENADEKVKMELEKALNFFGIEYKVNIVDRTGFNVRPSHLNKAISVSKHIQLGLFSVETTVKHEIVHIIRYVNKEFNNIKRSNGFLGAEEGLASFIGDYKSKNGTNSLFHHAAEYKASEIGLKGSLRYIYNFFISLGYPQDFSWQRAIRHKYGFTDTSEPGDIMKPAMYFYFENKIKDLKKDEIIKLFSAKLSLEALSSVKEYSGLVPKSKLVEYFNL